MDIYLDKWKKVSNRKPSVYIGAEIRFNIIGIAAPLHQPPKEKQFQKAKYIFLLNPTKNNGIYWYCNILLRHCEHIKFIGVNVSRPAIKSPVQERAIGGLFIISLRFSGQDLREWTRN